jgi:cyclophilin family peptidyl-prolyl cis-trans isomerase
VALPPSYTVFGRVTKGIETALAIQNVKTGQSDRPVEDIIIEKIELK